MFMTPVTQQARAQRIFWLLLLVDSYQLSLSIAEKVQHMRANEK
jgi:hypothetical protein